MRNFNGLLEVVAALNSAAIHRLKRTWEQLPAAVLRQFRDLDELTRPSRSHAALRGAMREGSDQPTVCRGLGQGFANPSPSPNPSPNPNEGSDHAVEGVT